MRWASLSEPNVRAGRGTDEMAISLCIFAEKCRLRRPMARPVCSGAWSDSRHRLAARNHREVIVEFVEQQLLSRNTDGRL